MIAPRKPAFPGVRVNSNQTVVLCFVSTLGEYMFSRSHGVFFSAFAFVLWGLIPLYFHFLPQANTNELIAFRVIFSVPLMLLILKLVKTPGLTFTKAMQNKCSLVLCFIAGILNSISTYAFMWALTHDQVLAASLGYFITPLFSIALGVLLLKDKLSLVQKIAVILAAFGLCYQIYQYGELPWISLVMGSFFALYGLVKKYVLFDSLTSMTMEVVLLLPLALGYMIFSYVNQISTVLASDPVTFSLYAGTALVTLIPLVLFAFAIDRTTLTLIGLTQYIEPSLQFLLAVFIFGEVLDQVKVVSFSFIWLGLILCTLEAFSVSRTSYKKTIEAKI